MKLFIKTLWLLVLSCSAVAQDTTITISTGIADPDGVPLGDLEGWYFKQGLDSGWAKKDLSVTGWERTKPSELSEKLADKNGRLEGWLRIKIKLDTAFADTALSMYMRTWAASEVYIDGNLLGSFGNTGENGKPYKEYNPTYKLPVPFNIQKGNEHIIAVHFVDFVSWFPPHQLKSEEWNYEFITITTPASYAKRLRLYMRDYFYISMWLLVNVILCSLFWLLAFLNRYEKNLFFIAITSTVLTYNSFDNGHAIMPGISNFFLTAMGLVSPIIYVASEILCLLLMLRIFKRKTTLYLKIILWLIFISGVVFSFRIAGLFSFIYPPHIIVFQTALPVFVFLYYFFTSRKTLKGAQWAVLVGMLLAISFQLLLALTFPYDSVLQTLRLHLHTGLFFSFPLSLLVYVAMRFKEIIKEVRQNAREVLNLSEEKRQQAMNQQKILQEEVNRQTAEIRSTLDNLKDTQKQLIQSEKMASLGELTAGIAHEIQNPLNFVNNFSEVSNELIDEMKTELVNKNTEEAVAIADNLKQNLEKIYHHGKRADAIVKGMLQHSQSSTGHKEPTDINALADEYLRLSYHGFRAKDKSFNAKLETDFDKSIGKINIIPQDIGRVLLNLYNNAFYAVNEKKNTSTHRHAQGSGSLKRVTIQL